MKGRTYRYFKGEPLYPFGYGLSYTRFTYSAAAIVPKTVRAGCSLKFTVDVKNEGARAGDEVVQVYVTRKGPAAPNSTLVGFTRIALKPGETRRLAFALDAKALSTVDEAGNHAVEAGPAYLWIGGGQPPGTSGNRRSSGVELKTTVEGRRSLPPF